MWYKSKDGPPFKPRLLKCWPAISPSAGSWAKAVSLWGLLLQQYE